MTATDEALRRHRRGAAAHVAGGATGSDVVASVTGADVDAALAMFIADRERDAATLGILLHGSRASGRQREDSDYDLICVVNDEAYRAKTDAGKVYERLPLGDRWTADVLYQTPSRIEHYVSEPGWYTATYLGAQVVFDRTGDIGTMLSRMGQEAGRIARERAPEAYDAYLNSFVRSLKSARHRDALGQRLHAAESALALIRTLFGLEAAWPPYHDGLAEALPELERAQGWPAGYLASVLSRLLEDGDPSVQQELEERVERLMSSRGIAHEWGNDLEPLKART